MYFRLIESLDWQSWDAAFGVRKLLQSWTFASDVDFKSDLQDDFQDRAWGYSHMLIRILSSLLVCLTILRGSAFIPTLTILNICANFPSCNLPAALRIACSGWRLVSRMPTTRTLFCKHTSLARRCQQMPALCSYRTRLRFGSILTLATACRHVPKQLCWRMSCAKSNLMSRARRCPYIQRCIVYLLYFDVPYTNMTRGRTRDSKAIFLYTGVAFICLQRPLSSPSRRRRRFSVLAIPGATEVETMMSINPLKHFGHPRFHQPAPGFNAWLMTWTRHRTQCESAGLYGIVLRLSHA